MLRELFQTAKNVTLATLVGFSLTPQSYSQELQETRLNNEGVWTESTPVTFKGYSDSSTIKGPTLTSFGKVLDNQVIVTQPLTFGYTLLDPQREKASYTEAELAKLFDGATVYQKNTKFYIFAQKGTKVRVISQPGTLIRGGPSRHTLEEINFVPKDELSEAIQTIQSRVEDLGTMFDAYDPVTETGKSTRKRILSVFEKAEQQNKAEGRKDQASPDMAVCEIPMYSNNSKMPTQTREVERQINVELTTPRDFRGSTLPIRVYRYVTLRDNKLNEQAVLEEISEEIQIPITTSNTQKSRTNTDLDGVEGAWFCKLKEDNPVAGMYIAGEKLFYLIENKGGPNWRVIESIGVNDGKPAIIRKDLETSKTTYYPLMPKNGEMIALLQFFYDNIFYGISDIVTRKLPVEKTLPSDSASEEKAQIRLKHLNALREAEKQKSK